MENSLVASQTPKCDDLNKIIEEIQSFIALPPEIIKCVFATFLSVKLGMNPPLWLMIVGVPSSAKTELVSLFRQFDGVYFLDSMTLNPFSSGYKAKGKDKNYDLLPELNNKCFVVKDYTTIFSLNEETTKKLLGELVSIYDGIFAKFSPTRGLIEYKSTFAHIGCLTPAALNRHQRYLNIVGPRFLFYRVPELTKEIESKGFEIAWRQDNRKSKSQLISDQINKYIDSFDQKPFIVEDKKIQDKIQKLSQLMAKSRGSIITQKNSFVNEDGKNIEYYEIIDVQIEQPWRAMLQLRGLAVSLAVLEKRNIINDDDVQILKNVVLSSMPAERAEALEYFVAHNNVTAKEINERTGKSLRTCQRLLKELEGLKIIESDGFGDNKAKFFNLTKDVDFIKNIKQNDNKIDYESDFIPRKPVKEYTNDEISGIFDYLKTMLRAHDIENGMRGEYLILIKEIEKEGINRKLMSISNLTIEDQILAEQSLN